MTTEPRLVRTCPVHSQDGYAHCIREDGHGGDHAMEPYDTQPDTDLPKPGELPITAWWETTASADLSGFRSKLAEYGSNDLVAVGRDLCSMMGWGDQPERVWAEIGCMFHLRSKLARAMEAYSHQRLPSDDTLKDITVYSLMMRRIRDRGRLE